MILNEAETNYLRNLESNPIWLGIMDKVMAFNTPPLYQGKEDDFNTWVYRSGVYKGIKGLISLLRGKEVNLILEDKTND